MIAMQYNFVLPADYNMDIVRQRIASKGHMLDNFPGLIFKAYLHASKLGASTPSTHNVYAPFYLWDSSEGMNNFLCGDGFSAVSQAFGWPAVKHWAVWHSHVDDKVRSARFATRQVIPVAAYSALGALREDEVASAKTASQQDGALAVLTAFDPDEWTLVRFTLWSDTSAARAAGLPADAQCYDVGHVSAPGR